MTPEIFIKEIRELLKKSFSPYFDMILKGRVKDVTDKIGERNYNELLGLMSVV